MGTRSAVARRTAYNLFSTWPASALLKLTWQSLGQSARIAKEFHALVGFLRSAGCSFHSCKELGSNPVPRGIAFRYDVHARDLPGAFVFAELHRQKNVPASFYVFWDYSRIETAYRRDFLRLNSGMLPPLDLGLHDSPVDAYLLQQRFDGDLLAYDDWLGSEDAARWFSELAGNGSLLDNFNASVFRLFQARVENTRRLFGPITTIAAHGGYIGQHWRPRLTELGTAAPVVRSFFARNWLTPERVKAVRLDAAVNAYGDFTREWTQCSCAGGKIVRMTQSLRRAIQRGLAVQILLHPYTWTGARRDAELSDGVRSSSAE